MCRRGVWCKWSFSASLVVLLIILGMDNMAHGQNIRSCGTPSPLSLPRVVPPAGPAASLSSGVGSLEVIPSICVSERYDSNVFYRPATPGLTRNDFVTHVSPTLLVHHNGDYASGFLNVGGFNETYVNNPDLNYFGTNDNLFLNLDNSIKRLFPNASLKIVEAVRYAPLPPGFASLAAGTSPGAPVNTPNVFAQGFLIQRTNNLTNNGTVSTSYATTASTSVSASYSYGIIRFGSSPVATQTSLFDTTIQTGTVGGSARLSGLDTLSTKYSYTQTESTSGSTSRLFKTNSATIGWSRTLTPNLAAELGGGGILINPGITTYAVNAALIMHSQNNSATISYSRSAYPSISNAIEPLVTDLFSLSASQKLDQQWQLAEAANYAQGSGSNGFNYNSYFASADVYYWVTRIWSTALSYDYMKYNSESGATGTEWARQAITFSVRASWE